MPYEDEELFGGEYKRGDGRAIRKQISNELTRVVQEQLRGMKHEKVNEDIPSRRNPNQN
jgi:hypothetical protein